MLVSIPTRNKLALRWTLKYDLKFSIQFILWSILPSFSAIPCYEESSQSSGKFVMEKSDDKKEEKDFKPTYIYYNFGVNPDQWLCEDLHNDILI
jgi:hypothetical protein